MASKGTQFITGNCTSDAVCADGCKSLYFRTRNCRLTPNEQVAALIQDYAPVLSLLKREMAGVGSGMPSLTIQLQRPLVSPGQ